MPTCRVVEYNPEQNTGLAARSAQSPQVRRYAARGRAHGRRALRRGRWNT